MVELILTLCEKHYFGGMVVKWVFLVEKAKKLDLNTPIMVEFLFEKN